jgi:YVTN family beta-propeller protein
MCAIALFALATPAAANFFTFESGQVRPLAQSPDGTQLFAVNTPDNRLEVFDVTGGGLTHTHSVPVGMEPVAVAVRPNGTQVWVVNHLSDSVSIVDLTVDPPRVIRTLLVGDEPRDIVFAGPSNDRAFMTPAHCGQNTPLQTNIDTELRTEGIGRADIWAFDAGSLGATLGGTPVSGTPVTVFGDTPRALAVSPNGSTVYAAVFHSGNQTATVTEPAVCNGGAMAPACNLDGVTMPNGMPGGQVPGGLPAPNKNVENTTGPEVGLIVKFNESTNHWEDTLGRNWNNAIRFSLPDLDVFAINANGTPTETNSFAHVGTVLFNMITNPISGRVYVTNTDANNKTRFEGPGNLGTTVRGHLAESHITVLDNVLDTVTPHHLNTHIVYSDDPQPIGVKNNSLATPTGMAITSNGQTLYVAAFGSSKVAKFNTTELESDTFTPGANHITVSGGGPSGLVLDEANDRLYVFTRFDDSISVINTITNLEIAHLPVYNPEPASIVDGRPFLYDAHFTSSTGEASCSSCHIFGDFDSLAWDLGNPDDIVRPNPNPAGPVFGGQPFHPMKGPMTTQTLRGMATHGPMHWRGDRTGGYDAPNIEPNSGAFDESAAFKAFNVAFGGLLGRDEGPLTDPQMQAFTDFILQVILPPNPIRDLTNDPSVAESAGLAVFNGSTSDTVTNCNGCHSLNTSQGSSAPTGGRRSRTRRRSSRSPT